MLGKKLNNLGQDHIVRLLETKKEGHISPEQIARDLEGVDFDTIEMLIKGEGLYKPTTGILKPVDVIPASFATSDQADLFIKHGEELIRNGKVAVLVVAGGQGSRLGIDGPKGAVGVTPVKGKSLFHVFAEKILALQRRYHSTIPWFIMTSKENDTPTKQYFKDNGYFSLNPKDIYFFVQGMLPSITHQGKFILSQEGGIFMNPDGHGGTLKALRASGSLDIMKDLGIKEIFYYQVDNPLVKICDPLFIGLHSKAGAQMSSKVVRKVDYEEKVAIFAIRDGKTVPVEYSDLDKETMYANGPDGAMLHWAGSIAIHVINRDFVDEITKKGGALPFHKAIKMIPSLTEDGTSTNVEGIKFETFVFDALSLARKSVTLECLREEEFAPVKNLSGVDSLESSRLLQSALHASWLKRLGVDVSTDALTEISPLFAIDYTDLKNKADNLPKKIVENTYIGE